jgi:hypothetical protein
MGYVDPDDYDSATDMVMKYRAYDGDRRPETANLMISRSVGGLGLSSAEWDQAQKKAREFRPYVS